MTIQEQLDETVAAIEAALEFNDLEAMKAAYAKQQALLATIPETWPETNDA